MFLLPRNQPVRLRRNQREEDDWLLLLLRTTTRSRTVLLLLGGPRLGGSCTIELLLAMHKRLLFQNHSRMSSLYTSLLLLVKCKPKMNISVNEEQEEVLISHHRIVLPPHRRRQNGAYDAEPAMTLF